MGLFRAGCVKKMLVSVLEKRKVWCQQGLTDIRVKTFNSQSPQELAGKESEMALRHLNPVLYHSFQPWAFKQECIWLEQSHSGGKVSDRIVSFPSSLLLFFSHEKHPEKSVHQI